MVFYVDINKLALITAVSSVLEEWLERRHGVLTYCLTVVLTGHGNFWKYLCNCTGENARVSLLNSKITRMSQWSIRWHCAPAS